MIRWLPLLGLACVEEPVSTHEPFTPADPDTFTLPAMEGLELVADPPAGTFVEQVQVELLASDPDARIWFTTDGTPPEIGVSTQYTKPLLLTESTGIRAISEQYGAVRTAIAPSYLRIDPSVSGFQSDLPTMILWTRGDAPTFKTELYDDFTLTVMDAGTTWPGSASTSERAGVKVRGSSSAGYPKHPYRIETWDPVDPLDVDFDVPLLGMPEEADWVALAPLNFDRGLIRNALMYRLSNELGRYAPRTRFVEMLVAERGEEVGPDDYVGIYVIVERVERDRERVPLTRLLPTDLSEPAITGGYLFKEDRTGPSELGFYAGTAGGQLTYEQPFVMVDPAEAVIPPAQQDYIAELLDELGDALVSPGFTHPVSGRHYEQIIDVDSWIDHHVLNVFAKNPDAFRLSGYFHKDREGLLAAGPLWDFDRTMGADQDDRATYPTWWDASNQTSDCTFVFDHGFWRGLFADPAFRARYWARWSELLEGPLSPEAVGLVIDEMEAELATSAPRNYAAWPSYPPRGGSFESEVASLRDWIITRQGWIATCLEQPQPELCVGL